MSPVLSAIIIVVIISSISILSLLSILSVTSVSSYSYSLPSVFGAKPNHNKGSHDSSSATTSRPSSGNEQVTNTKTDALRTYTNTGFNLTLQYPPKWGVIELNTNRYANSSAQVRGSSPVAMILSPFEDKSDKFQEKMLIGVQTLLPNSITLQDYTKSNLNAYDNQSNNIKILESRPTTLGGQPAYRIVFTDYSVKGMNQKDIQVWTVVNNSKAYVITFASEASKYNDYLPDAQKILSSFKFTSKSNNNLSSQSQGQRNQYITFYDPMFGVRLDYPTTWTKTQPGLPLDNRTLVFIASFIAPRPAISISENQNNSSSNSSAATINIGINNDVARFISTGKTKASPSFSKDTLSEYSSREIENIKRIGAQLGSSVKTTVGGLPGHEIYYLVGKDLRVIQAWTINKGKAYHIVLSAKDPDTFRNNLPVFHEIVNSMKFDLNQSKTNKSSS